MTSPTVSVVTACYRSAPYIARTFASIAAQSEPPLEWVAVDDASPDATAMQLERLAAQAPFEMRVIRHAENLGAVPSIREGIHVARGEFVFILDHDDELVADGLQRLRHAWRTHGQPAHSGVGARCVDQHGSFVGTPFPRSPIITNELHIRHVLGIRGELTGMVRTDLLREHYVVLGRGMTNGPVWRRIARLHDAVYLNDVVRIYHTDVPGSMVNTPRITSPETVALLCELDLNENGDYIRRDPRYFFLVALAYAKMRVYAGMGFWGGVAALRDPKARALYCASLAALPWVIGRDRRLGRI